jgi:hypothetical protein
MIFGVPPMMSRRVRPQFIASTGSRSGATTPTLTRDISTPAHLPGDLLIIGANVQPGTAGAHTLTTPAGWTVLREDTRIVTSDGSDFHYKYVVYYRVAGASEPSTVTLTSSRSSRWSVIAATVRAASPSSAVSAYAAGAITLNATRNFWLHFDWATGSASAPAGYTQFRSETITVFGFPVQSTQASYKAAASASESPDPPGDSDIHTLIGVS